MSEEEKRKKGGRGEGGARVGGMERGRERERERERDNSV
jgi:hypothetical protein